jgi:hypothetical protein
MSLWSSMVIIHFQRMNRDKQTRLAGNGGEGGIRTHGTLSRTLVFKTSPFNRSGTSPAHDF